MCAQMLPLRQAPLQPVGNALESLRSLVHDEPLDAEDTMKPGTGSATPVAGPTGWCSSGVGLLSAVQAHPKVLGGCQGGLTT